MNEIITVAFGSKKFTGWQSISLDWSYEDACMSFDLEVSEPQWSPSDMVPFLYDEVTISAGADIMATGYFDKYHADAEDGKHQVKISGRSKGADAVKSSAKHKSGRIENKTLVDAANELAQSAGIAVKFTCDIKLKPIAKIQLARHATVYSAVEYEARKQGAMLAAQPDGSVHITRPDGKRHAGSLVEGFFPVKGASVEFDTSGQHSPIIVRAQRAAGYGKDALRIEHIETDSSVKRVAPKIIHLEGDGDPKTAKNRAVWEKMRQAARGRVWTPRLSSWRDNAGKIWTPGLLVACKAPLWHINGDLMIKSVNFSQDLEDGTVATPILVDPRAMGGKKPAGSSGASWGADGSPSDLE